MRGAFTGAVRDRVGRFQLAHGGTIFLDEIGDVSSAVQLKLLRVLQEREFERVGDTRTVKVDVRVIAATNRPLLDLVRSGRLREDLYYRLRVVELHLPALRDRRSDIPAAGGSLRGAVQHPFPPPRGGVTPAALNALMAHAWPGNVRELRHALEHGFILSRGDVIDVDALPPEVRIAAGLTVPAPSIPRIIPCENVSAHPGAGGRARWRLRPRPRAYRPTEQGMREFSPTAFPWTCPWRGVGCPKNLPAAWWTRTARPTARRRHVASG